MDDDREIDLSCKLKLCPKDFLLDGARGEVVVVVEADLADRARPVPSERSANGLDAFRYAPGELTRLMRVDAGSKSSRRPRRRDCRGAGRLPLVTRRKDAQCGADSCRPSARNDRLEIAGEFLAGNVTVRINHE
jgi:hypothetical protein